MTKETPDKITDQAGPCGIICNSCPLGSGEIAETAGKMKQIIKDCEIPDWAPMVPEGEKIDWIAVIRGLDWMTEYTLCAGCEMDGGPPECPIRICAREKGYLLCSLCDELEPCTKFNWLKDHGARLKETLKENKDKSKKEYIKAAGGSMPWEG
jgi:hypothetical protein